MSNLSFDPKKREQKLSPNELSRLLAQGEPISLLDVREFPEFASGHISGARLLPLGEIKHRSEELDADQNIICICLSGKRSAQAAKELEALGFSNVQWLEGGIAAWKSARLPLQRANHAPWALDRQVRFAAGLFVLIGLAGSLFWPLAIVLSWFVGAGLVFSALVNWCGMGLLLARMPWNKAQKDCEKNCERTAD